MATKEIPEQHKWANDLKVGDIVFEASYNSPLSKTTVSKVSKAHIYVGKNNMSYPRNTLSRRSGSGDSWHLYPNILENESKWKLQQARVKVQSLAYDIYNTKTKRSIVEVMTITELLATQLAMETVCKLLDDAAKRATK